MKTTVDISDPLLEDAKRLARREGTTLRTLIERGLRHVVHEGGRRKPFKLRNASVGGNGMSPEFLREDGTYDWNKIYDEIHRPPSSSADA